MKSAGINFGIPDSEYIVRVDSSGAATSCYNQDTDTEYIGGGGGDGYLGIQTANVEITFDYSEVGEGIVNGFEDGFYDIRTENSSNAIQFTFGPYGFPVSLMGEPANLTIPIVEGYPTRFNITWIMNTNDLVIADEITVLSGSAEDTDDGLYITGDCSLLVKLVLLS